jgi:heptosyltransferase-3
MLQFADALGIARVSQVVTPAASSSVEGINGNYAVIHAAPFFRYKQWTRDGWRALAEALAARGLTIVATGGPGAAEKAYLDEIWNSSGIAAVRRFDGSLTWPALAGVLARARIYVGPDTSVTHLAAASGCPTVALFGPTDPRLWGPWPSQGLSEPWHDAADMQRRGNVWLVQNPFPCTPCQLEGCERRLDSYSACLDALPAARVIAAVEEALAAR